MKQYLIPKLFIVIFLLMSSKAAIAQDSILVAKELYDTALETFDYEHRKQSKEMFIQATKLNPNYSEAYLMAGKSILMTVHKEEALPYIIKAYELNKNVDPEILYLVGQAYHHSEKFDEAIRYYDMHRFKLSRSLSFEKIKNIHEVEWKIFECRNAKIYVANPVNVTITNLSDNINSEYPDYAPTISADESILFFTSRRPSGDNSNLAVDNEFYEDIYVSVMNNEQFEEAKPIGPPLNTLYHNASVGLSPGGKVLYMYTDENSGDIMESDFDDETQQWLPPKVLKGYINSQYHENSATVTADLQTMYFSSDRPGGYGGTDIYVSKLQAKDRWGRPQLLGPHINTERDEEAPFISVDGSHLYFSSNGHAGIGDLDIYKATFNEDSNAFDTPLNMGYPINTVENDIFFVLSGDEKHAYYSSVKTTSKGEQDIYKVNLEQWAPLNIDSLKVVDRLEDVQAINSAVAHAEKVVPVLPLASQISSDLNTTLTTSSNVVLEMTVVDAVSRDTLDANISIVEESTQNEYSPKLNTHHVYEFSFKNEDIAVYNIKINSEGYETYYSKVHVIGHKLKKHHIIETVALTRVKAQLVSVMNVYFAHNSDVPMTFEDIKYLEILMKNNPEILVEVSGHTDNIGNVDYNRDLSQRRADAIKNKLVSNGVDANRIVAKGYGMEKPVTNNDTKENRRVNRRIEFKVVGQ